MTPIQWQWILLLIFGVGFLWMVPWATSIQQFFAAQTRDGKRPNAWVLTSSLVISWIFAKSITNAANLSLEFGIIGGVSYAVYYFSFIVAGVVIYQLRTRGDFQSLHHFLFSKYGRWALMIFSLLVGFRLFNEVWSNTMVIGSYFGERGSGPYYLSILVFTSLTLLYTLKGGMSSSILTDTIQMIFFGIVLFILLGIILPKSEVPVSQYIYSSKWQMSTGLNFFFVAMIQVFSYPFHDAVLTDRGFISSPKTTLRSFLWAGLIGFVCILLFSLVGVYAKLNGLEGQATVAVGRSFGLGMMLLINFIMITSAASTLDSAFSSSAKLMGKDIGKTSVTVRYGRKVMVIFALAGTVPIFLNPTILSATTISGTMVLGLAPIFLFWHVNSGQWSFYGALMGGLICGIIFALGYWPSQLIFFPGKYGDLLSVNIIGTALSFVLFFTFLGKEAGNQQIEGR